MNVVIIPISVYALVAHQMTLPTPTNAHTPIKPSFIINTVFILHVSATHVTIFREVLYKGLIHRNITEVLEPIERKNNYILKIVHGLKCILKLQYRLKVSNLYNSHA